MVSITKRYGESCTASATPATGYEFTNWTEGGSQVSASPQYTFTVERSRNLTANFGSAAPSRYIDYTATSGPVSGNWVINYTDTSRNTYDNTTHQGRLYLTSNAPLGGGPSTAYTPFYNRTDLTRVDLSHSGLTAIGANTFQGSGILGINWMDMPSGLVSIGDYAFYDCGDLANVDLSYYDVVLHNPVLTTIGEHIFNNCGSLQGITLPSTLTNIGSTAFHDCGIESIACYATTPPEFSDGSDTDPFENTPLYILYVPSGYVSDYQSAPGWDWFSGEIIEF